MSLNAAEIAAVVDELSGLVGAAVQKASCPEPRTAFLELRRPRASARLLLCAEADRTRLHAVRTRPRSADPPYGFQGLLRKELVGRRFKSLRAAEDDRVVWLEFEGRGARRTLVAELTGRHGNLFVLDGDDEILGSAVANLSSRRDLFPGRPYVPPRLPAGSGRAGPVRFPAAPGPLGLSAAIEAAYAPRDAEARAAQARRAVVAPLRRRRDRIERTIDKVRAEAARGAEAEEHRRQGDLLIRNLGTIPRGARAVRVTEYDAGGVREVEVALDPARSPRENAERHFRQYRRLERGAARAAKRLADLEAERAALERRIADAEAAPAASLERLARPSRPAARARSEAKSPGATSRPNLFGRGGEVRPTSRRPGEAAGKPYREYRAAAGARIWVGRGAADNDALTFRHARGDDLWFHARDVTGAHVVLRRGQREVPEEARRDAAALAAWFSDARGEAAVDVTCTEVKHLRKPRGAPAGSVSVAGGGTIRVANEPDRIARLVASRAGEGTA